MILFQALAILLGIVVALDNIVLLPAVGGSEEDDDPDDLVAGTQYSACKDVDVVEAEKDQGTVFGVHLVEEVDSFVDVDNFEDLASDSNVGILTVESQDSRLVGNFAVLPLNTKFKGPAFPATSDYDIIDEVLDLFRANSFFKNFEIRGPSDRTLIYGILFVSQCLNALNASTSQNEAVRILTNLSLDNFSIPGEIGFPLNSLYQPPRDKNEALFLRQYLAQFRQELANRLIARIYTDALPSKYWLAFTRRKFMNKSL
ncbi:hypothetical protein OGAPHI_004893 [Ogataea philodendri]|uniref:Actin-related protein 2/3 complex subunit 3 n=1 Tax=Ogataea philodendri TaxID=1378263 RepID=A0A9P8P352_9ASCO|nr:uncharacterized protein OGAPHI_004893 [Ogataea philodendri]KAH3664179.1 hypothetical protein OGAPHI_004893 [Ogataea philodendri]